METRAQIPESFVTPGFLARRWLETDAPGIMAAITASLPELRRWTPWVIPEPFEVPVLAQRLRKFQQQFQSGETFIYGLFELNEAQVLGQAGLYNRVGPGALEIGYWIRSDATGRGHATESTRALIEIAFQHCGVERVEIRCEPEHRASSAIPRRLGFHNRGILEPDTTDAHGASRPIQVWELSAADYARLKREP